MSNWETLEVAWWGFLSKLTEKQFSIFLSTVCSTLCNDALNLPIHHLFQYPNVLLFQTIIIKRVEYSIRLQKIHVSANWSGLIQNIGICNFWRQFTKSTSSVFYIIHLELITKCERWFICLSPFFTFGGFNFLAFSVWRFEYLPKNEFICDSWLSQVPMQLFVNDKNASEVYLSLSWCGCGIKDVSKLFCQGIWEKIFLKNQDEMCVWPTKRVITPTATEPTSTNLQLQVQKRKRKLADITFSSNLFVF